MMVGEKELNVLCVLLFIHSHLCSHLGYTDFVCNFHFHYFKLETPGSWKHTKKSLQSETLFSRPKYKQWHRPLSPARDGNLSCSSRSGTCRFHGSLKSMLLQLSASLHGQSRYSGYYPWGGRTKTAFLWINLFPFVFLECSIVRMSEQFLRLWIGTEVQNLSLFTLWRDQFYILTADRLQPDSEEHLGA